MTAEKITIMVTGSRSWTDEDVLDSALCLQLKFRDIELLVVGDCPTGADMMAKRWAQRWNIPFRVYYANWEGEGRIAGPNRNQRMISFEQPDLCLAFYKAGQLNAGTSDAVRRAKKAKIPVIEYGRENKNGS